MNRWLSPALRLAVTLALLGLLAWQLDIDRLLARLGDLSPGWVLLAVLIGLPQVVLSAWRWRMTAHQVGIALPSLRDIAYGSSAIPASRPCR